MAFNKFRGGKLPPQRPLKMAALGDFLDRSTSWPKVPPEGWENAVKPSDWGMLGNDQWGDCAAAGIYHLIQGQAANSKIGRALYGTAAQALALYSAVTGFDPNAGPSGENPTDQGTVLTQLLAHVQKNGLEMTDENGKAVTVEIVGWAALDISSVAQRRYGAYTFGGAYLGINCPEEAEEDTTNWIDWPNSPIAGGHCITQEGEGAAGGQTVSWGQVIPTANSFYSAYLDEGYVVLSQAWLNVQEKSPTGLDLDALVGAIKQVAAA